ncbi:MAG TPA: hypothetical protein VM260_10595, partial [Pirellula sp.]|nr:hypothetical protein [Pirellula sp.]
LAIESMDDVQEVTQLDFAAEAPTPSPLVKVDPAYAISSASPSFSFHSFPVISSLNRRQANSDVVAQAARAAETEGSEGGSETAAQKSKSRASLSGFTPPAAR